MIHREGYKVIGIFFGILFFINILSNCFLGGYIIKEIIYIFSFILFIFVLYFFRIPKRKEKLFPFSIVAPADGKIVSIERVFESEYFHNERIKVSIFLSVFNVHINWFPISGIIRYAKYHPGLFLAAWNPKTSTKNERTTVVIENMTFGEILIRQIAGLVARRIICYAKINSEIYQNQELGFIRFGSRVDLYLPLDSIILVKVGQKVKGKQTIIAEKH